MIFAMAALMVSAIGAAPPAATPANEPDAKVLSDTSRLFPPVDATDTSAIITSTTESGFARLDLESVHFDRNTDRNGSPVLTASLVNGSTEDQKSGTLGSVRLPDPEPSREHRVTSAMETPSRKTWLALAFVEHGAAGFDAYSTRQSVGHGNVEDDPLMRPFANSPAIYVVTQVTPVLLDILARHMQRSEYGMLRHVWWVPQSLSAGVSIFAGVHNLRVAGEL
jgi:hypothetical protein